MVKNLPQSTGAVLSFLLITAPVFANDAGRLPTTTPATHPVESPAERSARESRVRLVELLRDKDSGTVRHAVRQLGGSKDKEACAILVDFYRHGETFDSWWFYIKE